MSGFDVEPGVDDPIEQADGVAAAGEYEADETTVSEDTGTRYAPDGEPQATPEDEVALEDDEL
ncbi:hypothetical protein [Nocardioides pacificus]